MSTSPRPRFVVDGHEFADEDSAFMGDGQFPPFVVFDVARQENLPGEYQTREAAQRVAAVSNMESEESLAIVERIRADLNALIDANNDVENTALHASPEHRTAQSRGNALRNALNAMKEYD